MNAAEVDTRMLHGQAYFSTDFRKSKLCGSFFISFVAGCRPSMVISVKKIAAILALFLLLSACSTPTDSSSDDVPTDYDVPKENMSSSLFTEPSANNEPINVTAKDLLEFFEVIESEHGPLISEQNLTYKHMVDVMGTTYDEDQLEDCSLTYRYDCTDGAIQFHYNRDSGPFDFITLSCFDHIEQLTLDFCSGISFDAVISKIDEYNQDDCFYGYYSRLPDKLGNYKATWVGLEHEIIWYYSKSDLSVPNSVEVWNSNLWAYCSDPSGWTLDFVTMDGAIGEFDYRQYEINNGYGGDNSPDNSNNYDVNRAFTDDQIAQVALNDFHNKIVSDLRRTMVDPPSYLGILDGCVAEAYTVSFDGYSNTYTIVLNARYGTNILDMGFIGGSSRYVINATYQDVGGSLMCTSFSYS